MSLQHGIPLQTMFASRAVFAAILVAFVSLPAQAAGPVENYSKAIDVFSTLDTLSAARCPTVTCTAGTSYPIHLDGAEIYLVDTDAIIL
jgi:hypothetical protein